MDFTHIHLLLNHFPIIGTLIGSLILFYGFTTKNTATQKISLTTIVAMALIAIPVFLTGEPAEETVEKISGISKSIIKSHEESAEIAFWIMEAAGIMALIALILLIVKNKMAQSFVILALGSSLVTFCLMARTGYLGGKIRHTEIAGNTAVTQATEKEDD